MSESDRILTDEQRTRLNQIWWLHATQGDFHFLQSLSDDQLLCLSMTPDLVAVVESNRRVINALKNEAQITTTLTRQIARLTKWLVGFTVGLFVLTVLLVVLTVYLVLDTREDKGEAVVRALEKIERQVEKNGESTDAALKELSDQLRNKQDKKQK